MTDGVDDLGAFGAPDIPVEGKTSRLGEIGSTGLNRIGGYVSDEFLRQLVGAKAARAFREIADNSPIASGIILGYQNVATHLDWHIEADPDAGDGDQQALDFLTEAFSDLDDDWDSTLSQIMSIIVFGWSWHEIIYKKRDGKGSAYNDGKIGWKNFPIRSQDSLERWAFAENGDVRAMIQRDPNTGRQITIPAWKSLLFRTTEMKNNPEGRSLLRGAYVSYQYLRRIQEYEAIGIERDLAGLPVVWVPLDWMDSTDPDKIAAVNKMTQMVKDVRRNEREGLILPMIYEKDNLGSVSRNKGMDFELLSSSGARQFDTEAIITRYNQQIGMSLLADFITMGHEGVGSFALGTAKLDLWIMVVDSLCKSIAEVFNKQAIKKLLDLNGISYTKMPKLVYGEVENIDLAVIGQFVSVVSAAGLLTPDEGTEAWLREKASMPPVEVTGPPPGVALMDQKQQMAEATVETMKNPPMLAAGLGPMGGGAGNPATAKPGVKAAPGKTVQKPAQKPAGGSRVAAK